MKIGTTIVRRIGGRFTLSMVVALCATVTHGSFAQERAGNSTDVSTNLPRVQVVAQIPVGNSPTSIVVSPDSQYVYVGNWNDYSVSIIRAGANVVTSTISTQVCPQSMAVTPNGDTLYVTDTCGNRLAVIDTASDRLLGYVEVGNTPWALAMSPAAKHQVPKLYVSNYSDGTISIINTDTNKVTGRPIKVGGLPQELLFSPDGKYLYLYGANPTRYGLGRINVVTRSYKHIGNQWLTQKALSITPDGSKLYSISLEDDSIVCFDCTTNKEIAEIAAPAVTNLNSTAMSRDGRILYVTVANELKPQGLLYMLDTTKNQFVGKPVEIDHSYADTVAMAPDGKTLYAADLVGNAVIVISIETQ
jgi:YVTN family beta-propeller protein